MSELKTNKISTNSNNNVALDNALNLKNYTTTQRDALTSAAGDMIYNSTDSKVQVYNGSSWVDLGGSNFTVDFLVIGGGGSGGRQFGGGGGAGGYRNSYNSETSGRGASSETSLSIAKNTNILVSVGAGGAGNTDSKGSISIFNTIVSEGGGSSTTNKDGGSGAGGAASSIGPTAGSGTTGQGYDGGSGSATNGASAGGGGAGAAGGDNSASTGPGAGGAGLASSITGSSVTRAGGGGGSHSGSSKGAGGSGGGGQGGSSTGDGDAGTVNTGGGGGARYSNSNSMAGGSGIVIIRYATADASITVGSGLTSTSATDGSDTIISFTAGTGNITFS